MVSLLECSIHNVTVLFRIVLFRSAITSRFKHLILDLLDDTNKTFGKNMCLHSLQLPDVQSSDVIMKGTSRDSPSGVCIVPSEV